MSALFPNVPIAPGVPSVKRLAGALAGEVLQRLTGDQLLGSESDEAKWGIYGADGFRALSPDSFYAFEFGKEYRISDFPVEGGTFESYDKVETPYLIRLEMTKGGTEFERSDFLAIVASLVDSTDTFEIVTPDEYYPNANLVRYDFRRTAINGVQLLTVNLVAQQVRAAAEAQFTSSKSASGADPASNGPVQAVPVEGAQPSGV